MNPVLHLILLRSRNVNLCVHDRSVISKDDITNLIPGINLNNKSIEGNIYHVQKMLLKFRVDITPA